MLSPALTPSLLHSPSTRLPKLYSGLRRGLMRTRCVPGKTKGLGVPEGWYVGMDTGLLVGVTLCPDGSSMPSRFWTGRTR